MENSLYERLRPEAVEWLNNQSKLYPTIIGMLVEQLKENTNFGALTLSSVTMLAAGDGPMGVVPSYPDRYMQTNLNKYMLVN